MVEVRMPEDGLYGIHVAGRGQHLGDQRAPATVR